SAMRLNPVRTETPGPSLVSSLFGHRRGTPSSKYARCALIERSTQSGVLVQFRVQLIYGLSAPLIGRPRCRCHHLTLPRFLRRWSTAWMGTDMRTGGFPMENVAA